MKTNYFQMKTYYFNRKTNYFNRKTNYLNRKLIISIGKLIISPGKLIIPIGKLIISNGKRIIDKTQMENPRPLTDSARAWIPRYRRCKRPELHPLRVQAQGAIRRHACAHCSSSIHVRRRTYRGGAASRTLAMVHTLTRFVSRAVNRHPQPPARPPAHNATHVWMTG